MGDDPKPRDEAEDMTPELAAQWDAAIDAQMRRGRAEASRAVQARFRPAPPEMMIRLYELAADEILDLAVSELQKRGRPASGLQRRGRRSAALLFYIRRRLADVGVSFTALPSGELSEIRSRLERASLDNPQFLKDHIKEKVDTFVDQRAAIHNGSPEEAKRIAKEFVEQATYWKLYYYRMSDEMVNYVEDRLRSRGTSDPDAIRIAEKIVAYFENPGRYPNRPADRAQVDLVVDLVLSVNDSDFNRAAKLTLPPRAPAIWSRREDREKGENVLRFLERVWGPYMDAGILYQDDIKRLGDAGLVPSVRAYCHQHGLDASTILPPPQKVRLERALAEAEPGSPAAALLAERLRKRERVARRRSTQRQPA